MQKMRRWAGPLRSEAVQNAHICFRSHFCERFVNLAAVHCTSCVRREVLFSLGGMGGVGDAEGPVLKQRRGKFRSPVHCVMTILPDHSYYEYRSSHWKPHEEILRLE